MSTDRATTPDEYGQLKLPILSNLFDRNEDAILFLHMVSQGPNDKILPLLMASFYYTMEKNIISKGS